MRTYANILRATLTGISLIAWLLTSVIASAKEREVLFVGHAANVTVAKVAGVTFTMKLDEKNNLSLEGSFDNQTLFGTFDLKGKPTEGCAEGNLCVQFKGKIQLGGMGGWPKGTKTSVVFSLSVDGNTGQLLGTYHIGKLPSISYEQYGVIQADVSKK